MTGPSRPFPPLGLGEPGVDHQVTGNQHDYPVPDCSPRGNPECVMEADPAGAAGSEVVVVVVCVYGAAI